MILLFSFLYPSWNFFDRAGMVYKCEFRDNRLGKLIELYPRPISFSSIFFSSQSLEYLFFHSVLASFAEKCCSPGIDINQIFISKEYKNLLALIHNYLTKNNYILNDNFEIQISAKKLVLPELPHEIVFKTQTYFRDSK